MGDAAASAALAGLARTLRAARARLPSLEVVAGFDGFIDEIISVVGERQGVGRWTPMGSMAELGGLVAAAAGRNALREIVVRGQDAGGCSLNLADGLAALGVPVDHFATLGQPRHAAFAATCARFRSSTAWGTQHGRTLAFEFADGKFFFSAVEQLGELAPELLVEVLADGAFQRACARARLIAFTNWTLYPHMTACWRHLQEHVLAQLTHRPWLFIDLVDPSGRSTQDILAMLGALSVFERTCATAFGLNVTEAVAVGRVLGLDDRLAHEPEALRERAAAIRAALGISEVVIHNVRMNALAGAGGSLAVPAGPHCAAPRKSTGAGDRFNAGYCLGLMLGLDPAQRLDLGSATSGFFVRQGRSASLDELAAFIDGWAAGDPHPG